MCLCGKSFFNIARDTLIKYDNFTLAKMCCIFPEVRCNRITIPPHFVKNTTHFISA